MPKSSSMMRTEQAPPPSSSAITSTSAADYFNHPSSKISNMSVQEEDDHFSVIQEQQQQQEGSNHHNNSYHGSLDASNRHFLSINGGGIGGGKLGEEDDDDEDNLPYPEHVPKDVTMGDFFHTVMNNGAADNVICFKMIVFLILVMAALIIGNAAFIFTTEEINTDFLTEFDAYATDVVLLAQDRVSVLFDFTISLRDHVVGQCIETSNCTWPFVTLSSFEERHYRFIEQGQVNEVALLPLIQHDDRTEWEQYSVANQGWVQDGIDFRLLLEQGKKKGIENNNQDITVAPITPYIHTGAGTVNEKVPAPDREIYAAMWQIAPATINPSKVNIDAFLDDTFRSAYLWMEETRHPLLSQVLAFDPTGTTKGAEPQALLLEPMGETFEPESNLVAVFSTLITWSTFFKTSIPPSRNEIILVLEDSCVGSTGGSGGGSNGNGNGAVSEADGTTTMYSYAILGDGVTFLGLGDLHDANYNDLSVSGELPSTARYFNEDDDDGELDTPCKYTMTLYPTEDFRKSFDSNDPLIYTSVVLIIMVSTVLVFCLYDYCVERRQDNLAETAAKSNALVSSLFPEQVREQLLRDEQRKAAEEKANPSASGPVGKSVEKEDPIRPKFLASKPIAELFPETTILFADIVGFSAWSSAREPAQVFTLLETIYNNFDAAASKRGIFKVETIGDSYVAGAGLPEPRKDHAVAMARFAYCIIRLMGTTVQALQVTLGPDTEDLTVRVGLHSGPVTGGVLRGEKSRFQLFGDTMNTAARMESNGKSGMVHMSGDTAELLKKAGRVKWVKAREDLIHAKGKGQLQTYWLDFKAKAEKEADDGSDDEGSTEKQEQTKKELAQRQQQPLAALGPNMIGPSSSAVATLDNRSLRVVNWLVDMLMKYLKQIIAMRDHTTHERTARRVSVIAAPPGGTVLDEVQEIIALPTLAANYNRDPESVQINPKVKAQLVDFVSRIASKYRQNDFHNFEHASHVTMSVAKLLSRIVSPHDIDYSEMTYKQKKNHAKLHQQTYGITSDPLTQFAIIFSGLIHDVDHTGVPNAQLVKEGDRLAQKYKGKSVAEQNSVDLAWSMLLRPNYSDLLRCICASREERMRFRQLVVNAVMATDIVDKELGALRKQRWEKAFSNDNVEENPRDRINRKATIVIEHLIQASDVAHTMQHWHVYQKWNRRFFRESYKAYKDGRAEKDPSEGWYQGELGFFDFYIIPLAKKLKDCGVFGVSSDEYLNYAVANRDEWEKKGKEVVQNYCAEFEN